jgi:hypothetical protein
MATPSGKQVDLLGTVEVLHGYLTPALCAAAFEEVRTGERRRAWTLECLMQFWTAVILRAPASLTQALEEASGGATQYPKVKATPQAFFSRSKSFSFEFFERVFEGFVEAVRAGETPRFFAEGAGVSARFGGTIWALDGSTLDPVARRLKALWDDSRIVLPGSIVAFYDLSTGALARLRFEETPLGKEPVVAREELLYVPRGGLVLGDRLFGTPKFFGALTEKGLFGLIRRSGRANVKTLKRLSRRRVEQGVLEEDLVSLGTSREVVAQTLRRVRLRLRKRTLELLTNVLDPQMLSAQEALSLYAKRWRVERLFFELKEVLNLHRFYAANVNAVAAQVYAAAIVHVAFRAAQARIAHEAKIEPERISPQKLFPRVAAASVKWTEAEAYFDWVCETNPGKELKKPSWANLRCAKASLASVLVRTRATRDTKPRPRPGRGPRRALPPAPPRPHR